SHVDGTVSAFGLQSDCNYFDPSLGNCSVPGPGPGLAVDNADNVFAESGSANNTPTNQAIYKFTSAGVRSVFAGPDKFTDFTGEVPAGLACDSVGNLFASTNDASFATG